MSTNKEIATLINQISSEGMLPDTNTHKVRFDIRSSSSNRLYRVSVRKSNNVLECSCPGWCRHRKCKHIEAIAPTLSKLVDLLALEEGNQ